MKAGVLRRYGAPVLSGPIEQGWSQVDRRGHRCRCRSARNVRVTHDQRYVEVLVVDKVALLTKTVRPGELAVVGREEHDRPVGLSGGLERIENGCDVAIDVTETVQVEVQPAPPVLVI